MMHRIAYYTLGFLLLCSTTSTLAYAADESIDFATQVKPLLEKYCYQCHNEETQEGDVRLDVLNPDMVKGNDGETWHDALNKLSLGEMPPEDEEQPETVELKLLMDWVNGEIKRAAAAKRSTGGNIVVRRLNRSEYQNTMRDLLGIDIDFAKNLPPEPSSAEGFKNNGSSLGMAPLQLEYYLQAARDAMQRVIVIGEQPKLVEHQHTTDYAKSQDNPKAEEPPVDDKKAKKKKPPKETYRLGLGGDYRFNVKEYPREGRFRVRVRAHALIPAGFAYPQLEIGIGLRSDTRSPEQAMARVDVSSGPDAPQTFEFEARIEEFPLPGHNPKFPGIFVVTRHVSDSSNGNNKGKKKATPADPTKPIIVVEAIEFTGPLMDAWPPAEHRQILFAKPSEMDDAEYTRAVLKGFLARAYRRPAQATEIDQLFAFYQRIRPTFDSYEETMREVLSMALISPQFLYMLEPQEEKSARRPLTQHELATRLSYFLWSTMPDRELTDLADSQQLTGATLQAQVRRLLQDERSTEFLNAFSSQWLQLDALERVAINPEYYPKFNNELKADMRAETQRFFAEVVRSDLSALQLIDANFTMLNHRLAQHYGIEGPRGSDFERVALAPEHRRGGLLTHASVLMLNSNGEGSHPIKRAVWIRDRLLGDPPPPPPPDVPELDSEEPDFAKLTLREQLEVHRKKAACNQCHKSIDPWGIPAENYDAIGLWRTVVLTATKEGKRTIKHKSPVATETTLPDGAKIRDIEELKSYLAGKQKDKFSRALVSKLLAYALGRSLEYTDKVTVEILSARFEQSGYKINELILAIVENESFQSK